MIAAVKKDLRFDRIEDSFTRLWKADVALGVFNLHALGVFNLKPSCVCI